MSKTTTRAPYFAPTHELIVVPEGSTIVMLTDEGAAYTVDEWLDESPADWEYTPELGWRFQGEVRAMLVRRYGG